jgi:hypothetical protein
MEGEMSLPMRLLQLVSYGGIRSTRELGKRLGVSETLVTMMAEDLRRRGYLQAVSGGTATDSGVCGTSLTARASACGSCGIAASCKLPGTAEQLPLLTLTEKGKLAAPAAQSGARGVR